MKIKQTLLALGIAALSATAIAQPNNFEPQRPRSPNSDHRSDHRWDNDRRDHGRDHRDRDFRHDRDYKRWNDHDHRRNYETRRSHVHELRLGMRKREVLELPWWKHPMFIRDNGPFDEYVYTDGRHGKCVLDFKFNRLTEIHCN